MAPSVLNNRKHHKLYNNITAKKLKRSLVINAQLHRRILMFSTQNKELSFTLNNSMLHKIKMENENNLIKNENIQLNAVINVLRKKLNVLEETLQKCVPALVTLSECVPSMMGSVHEMSKFDKIIESKKTEKKEKQTRTVRPMISGMTTKQPAITARRYDISPIIESPRSEQSPRQTRKSSSRSLPHYQLGLEPYVRLKDVAVLFKNSKSVPSKNSPKRQQVDNLEEGLSSLHELQNSDNNSSASENDENSRVLNKTYSPLRETINEVQTDMSLVISNLNGDISNNMFNETEIGHISLTSSTESSMLKNITCRKLQRSSSSETSLPTDIDVSITSSTRSRKSTTNVNYQEPTLKTKFRRN